VTGAPDITGNGILNPSGSFDSGERSFEGVGAACRDLRGVGREDGNVVSLETVGAFGNSGRSARGMGRNDLTDDFVVNYRN